MIVLKSDAETVAFDGIHYVKTEVDYGVAGASRASVKGVGQIGERVVNADIDTRRVFLTGFIRASSETDMREKKAVLYRLCDPRQEFTLYPDDRLALSCYAEETVRFAPGTLLNNEKVAKFNINLYCHATCVHIIYTTCF